MLLWLFTTSYYVYLRGAAADLFYVHHCSFATTSISSQQPSCHNYHEHRYRSTRALCMSVTQHIHFILINAPWRHRRNLSNERDAPDGLRFAPMSDKNPVTDSEIWEEHIGIFDNANHIGEKGPNCRCWPENDSKTGAKPPPSPSSSRVLLISSFMDNLVSTYRAPIMSSLP